MTFGDNVVRDPFAESFVKNEILSFKFTADVLPLDLMHVANYPAPQLVDILEAVMFKVGAGFLAANSPCAVKKNFFVFM